MKLRALVALGITALVTAIAILMSNSGVAEASLRITGWD